MSFPRTARTAAGGLTGAVLALGLALAGVAPASAVPLDCSGVTDGRSAVDRLPKQGAVVPLYDADAEEVYYELVGVDEDKVPYYLSLTGLPDTVEVVGLWENSTACDGDDFSRNAWVATPGGAVYADGDTYGGAPANYFGGANTLPLQRPVVGLSATGTGDGYWLVAADGGIFTFGDARFFGSTGNIRLNRPVVGMSTTPSGNGYWMVASDGGIFTFGDAVFRGSAGAIRLNEPIIGMVATPTGNGYWLVAEDGGVFTYGDAVFRGSLGGEGIDVPAVGLVPAGDGYVIFTADGGSYAF
ncbi:hypothetical protein [Aquipuribacter hungaricus]|uniref:Uncharacterized protein n=1 Tax=Aquipuribacter hungaricus TaxID=545624 RepID=A0ABV7WLG8_9MICO